MKKTISTALTVAIITTNVPVQAFAENIMLNNNSEMTNEQLKSKKGNLEVDINFGLPIRNVSMANTNIKVELKKDDTVIAEIPLGSDMNNNTFHYNGNDYTYSINRLNFNKSNTVEKNEKQYYYRICFENLPAGENVFYGFNISGDGFKTATIDDIELNDYSKRVIVSNIKEDDKNGAILFGDVNKDGKVDEADYDELYSNLGSKNLKYDLNKDSVVNISDLTYVHKNMNKSQGKANVEDTDAILDIESIELTLPDDVVEGQEIVGDANDLFSDEGTVTLQLPEEMTISEETPAKLDIDLASKQRNSIMMEQIVIKGGTNAPKTGYVEIDGVKYEFGAGQVTRSTTGSNDIVIDLKGQIPVAKITINVTGTTNDRNLVDIAKVEFLNNVYKEIPKPEISIPVINKVKTSTKVAHESMEIEWGRIGNITGYEVKVEEINESGKVLNTRMFKTSDEYLKVRDIKAYGRYRVSVQGINGEWQGGYKVAQADDIDGVPDNIQADSIASGNYIVKDITPDSIVEIMVVPEEKPEPPEGISLTGRYRGIDVSWKKHNSAQSFNVYYRKLGSDDDFKKANTNPIVNATSYSISDLEDGATYEVKLTATNHLGTSGMSKGYTCKTTTVKIPNSPNYNLINLPKGENILSSHIESVEFPKKASDKYLDTFDDDSIVDNDYTTAWAIDTWDCGLNSKTGPIVTFDEAYTMDRVVVIPRLDIKNSAMWRANIGIWDETTKKWTYKEATVQSRNDNGPYVILKLDEPITAKKIQINTSMYASNIVSMSELKFYKYDSIEKDIKALFEDDLQIELRKSKEVTQAEINELRDRLNTKDKNTGEYHPDKASLLKELQIAEDLLKDKGLSEKVVTIDPMINASGANTGYSNDWQSLGFSAKAGDTINVYLATNEPNKEIWFGYEQHYAESGSFLSKEKIVLKPGKNTIQIGQLTDLNVEKGGNLYVKYPYSVDSSNAQIKIRVSGATEIPHLNLNNYLEDVDTLVNNKANSENAKVSEVKAKLKEYILDLNEYVTKLPSQYKKGATEQDNINNIYSYDEKTSILNSTSIEGDRFTLTFPATDVYRGISDGIEDNIDAQVDRLYDTVLAWEQIIQITNAKKGVYEKLADFNGSGDIDDADRTEYNNNKASRSRVNIKYQRMFIGAFMYASGHHVGIDDGSVESLMKGVPYKFDSEGKVINPNEASLFGWGISHEIGHKADIGNRTYSETTNNILALITQTFDGVDKSRLEENGTYRSIYEKVTSGSVGVSQDINTLLGMFWQLHLAYEPGSTSQMLKNNSDNNPNNDSYFAKMNRAYRNTKAETTDKNQLLIRRASDAAGKDLRAFFASWGILADESTSIYLQQKFPNAEDKETRKIQYLNDEAYRQRLAGVKDMSKDTVVEATFEGVEPNGVVNGDSITLNLDVNMDKDKILGYEIIRSDGNYNENGETKVSYRPVGFVEANKNGKTQFTDSISPLNNRAITYKVVAYDYNLNPTDEFEIGSVKFSHDGSIDSSKFVLKSNLTSDIKDMTLDNIKDGNISTVFKGRKLTNTEYNNNPHKVEGIDINVDPYIVMDLKGSKDITGLKYTKSEDAVSKFSLKRLFSRETVYNPIDKYEIHISDDNKTWTKVSEGKFEFGTESVLGGSNGKNIAKVLFNSDGNLYTYSARYVKLVAVGATNLDIADIELIGSTGDNIEIGAVNSKDNTRTNGIGKLASEFVVQNEDAESGTEKIVIPEGSIVVTGEYKGNPAFNVPLLIDENNKTIDGEVILMANVPDDAPLGSVADGKWIYWISKDKLDSLTGKVKAELYRYNALEDGVPVGQRLVSDTLYVNVPEGGYESLPTITLENSGNAKSKSNVKTKVSYRNSKNLNEIEEFLR